MVTTFAYAWNFEPVLEAWPQLRDGVLVTIQVAVVTMAIAFVLSPLVALARIYAPRPIRLVLWLYVETFRLTPLLVQLIWFLYVVPVSFGLKLPVFWLGVIPLSLNVTAFMSEVWRGGVLGVAHGQREAALALGMSEGTALRRIVMPTAFRQGLPVFATMWVTLFKDSSLVAIVGVHDLLYEARDIALTTYLPIETYAVVVLVYFLLTYPQSLILNRVYERTRVIS
jgi:polar amino acid transport system permease protein